MWSSLNPFRGAGCQPAEPGFVPAFSGMAAEPPVNAVRRE